MTLYQPRHRSQLTDVSDPYRKVNCAAYAAAMAFDLVTLGGVDLSGRQVRALTDEPIPAPTSPGLNLPQLDRVAAELGISLDVFRPLDWWVLVKLVRLGRPALTPIIRSELAGFLGDQPFGGSHMVLFSSITPGGSTLIWDPLRDGPIWVSPGKLRAAWERFGRLAGYKPGLSEAGVLRAVPVLA